MTRTEKTPSKKTKTVELQIAGHPVVCTFPKDPDPTAAKCVRNCLLDSYIQKYGINENQNA